MMLTMALEGRSLILSSICPSSSFGRGGKFTGSWYCGVELFVHVWAYYGGGNIGCGGAEGLGNADAYGSGV